MNPRNRIHASIAYVNGHLTVSKRSERGTGLFNVYVRLDETNSTTIVPEESRELINRTQQMFYTKIPNKL
jgi:hypothetical protein